MFKDAEKHITYTKLREYYDVICDNDELNKECKMNNRFLTNKEDCQYCQYNHICKEKDK